MVIGAGGSKAAVGQKRGVSVDCATHLDHSVARKSLTYTVRVIGLHQVNEHLRRQHYLVAKL